MRFLLPAAVLLLLAGCSGISVKSPAAAPGLPAAVKTVAVRLDYPSEAYPAACDKFLASMQSKAPEIDWRCWRKGKGDARVDVHVDWSREGEASGPSRYLQEVQHPFGPGSGAAEHYEAGNSTCAHQNAEAKGTVTAGGVPLGTFKYQLTIEERGNGLRSDLYDALLDLLARKLAADLTSGRPASKPAKERGVEWVPMRGGSFLMGGGGRANANPRHLVRMPPFEIAKNLVTFGQYAKCVQAGACTTSHTIDGTCTVYDARTATWGNGVLPDGFETDDQPAVCVDWEQARAYSKWAGGRLPTEAEYEYAARDGGREQKYPWGNEAPSCDRAVMTVGVNSCKKKTTKPVCSRAAGNTEFGLCDMTGNASEWVEDWYRDSYRGASADGSAQEDPTENRVLRGASWAMDMIFAPAAMRNGEDPATRSAAIGFRPSRSAPPKATISP